MPVDQAYVLGQQFAHMLRTRTGEQLDDWLRHAKASKIRELQGFLDFRETGQSSRDGRTHASTQQWSRRRKNQ
jgi:hypothetical protein